jgi:(p)ppGpp synthase/HD superfamily hydrolase
VLHRFDCGNLLRAKQKDEQWLEVDWQADDDEEFEVLICIQNENRRGMLASIANAIAKVNINIENLEIEENDDTMKALKLLISVSGLSQLDEAMCAIKSLEFIAHLFAWHEADYHNQIYVAPTLYYWSICQPLYHLESDNNNAHN